MTTTAIYLASGQTVTPVDATTGVPTGAALAGGAPFVVTPIRTYLFTGGPYYGGLQAVESSSGEPDEWHPGARGSFSSVTTA